MSRRYVLTSSHSFTRPDPDPFPTAAAAWHRYAPPSDPSHGVIGEQTHARRFH